MVKELIFILMALNTKEIFIKEFNGGYALLHILKAARYKNIKDK